MEKAINKSEVCGKMARVEHAAHGMIKFSMMIAPDEAVRLKNVQLTIQSMRDTGFDAPPCAIGFWSRDLLLLIGQIEAGASEDFRLMLDAVIEKLISEALNGVFDHARKAGKD